MSVHYRSPVWMHSKRRGTELLALLALADIANDEGVCWPSISSISKRLRMDAKQARRTIHELIEGEEIRLVSLGGGSGRSNRYQIDLDMVIGNQKTLPLEGENSTNNPPAKGRETPPIEGRDNETNPPAEGSKIKKTLPSRGQNPPIAMGEEPSGTVKKKREKGSSSRIPGFLKRKNGRKTISG